MDRLLGYGQAAVPYLREYWALAVLGGILALAAAVRIYEIGGTPAGFFADEAGNGFTAYSILHTGKDPIGQILPLFPEYGAGEALPPRLHLLSDTLHRPLWAN